MDRLLDHPDLLRFRPRDRLCPETICENQRGFSVIRQIDSRMDRRFGISFGESGCTRSDWDGSFRRQIWNCDEPFLLAGRHSRDGLRGHFHDALLLRLEGEVGARLSVATVRRKDARLQRLHFRRNDHDVVGYLDVRDGLTASDYSHFRHTVSRLGITELLGLPCQHYNLGRYCPRLYLFGWIDERDLQRSDAVFSDRRRLLPAGFSWARQRRRLERADAKAAASLCSRLVRHGQPPAQPFGSRLV